MDSGNSGSMQSSSGGDEEYDSRGESISSFLNPSGHFASISDQQQPPLLSHQQPTLFNPHSQNLDGFPQASANTQYGNDLVWSRGLRSEPNYANFGNLAGFSSSSSSQQPSSNQSVLGAQAGGLSQAPFASSSSMPSQSNEGNATRASQQSDQPTIVKNPKKRTRASRRAPTTVLTTDTTNFRQMVQEFTGIPTAPFSGSPYSRRLDLFSGGSGMRSGHMDSLGPLYPLRPSAQKVQLSPFLHPSSSTLLNSSMIDALVSSTANTTGAGTNNSTDVSNTISTSSNDYPSELGQPKQPQNLLNMQNQMLAFQPLFQSSLHPSLRHHPSSVLGTKSQGSTPSVPSFDDLRMNHENVNTNLSGLIPGQGGSRDVTHVRGDTNIQRWRDGGILNNRGDQEQQQLGPFDANKVNSQQHISGYEFNSSASTSEFHPDKGLENVSSAGEGTVGSWICPSG